MNFYVKIVNGIGEGNKREFLKNKGDTVFTKVINPL